MSFDMVARANQWRKDGDQQTILINWIYICPKMNLNLHFIVYIKLTHIVP